MALNEGPVDSSTVARFADTVEAISRGITVGATRRGPSVRARRAAISRCVSTSPVPLPTTTAASRVAIPASATAIRAARSASSATRLMKRAWDLSMPSRSGLSSPG